MSDIYNDFFWTKQSCSSYRNFQVVGDFALRFSCPICGDSEKDKKAARGNVYRTNKNILKYKCFNCDYGPVHVSKFLKQTDSVIYKSYILDLYPKRKQKEPELSIKTKKPRFINKKVHLQKATDVDICLKYLKSREIPEHHYDKFYYSENFAKFVVEEYNQDSKYLPKTDPRIVLKCESKDTLIGLIGRSLNPDNSLRYMNAKLDKDFDSLVFGLTNLNLEQDVYAIEGAFDSLFVDNSISVNSSALTTIANMVPKENLVLVWDNEPRNLDICRIIKKGIDSGFRVVIWPIGMKEKDINEMVLSGNYDIQELIRKNTFQGLKAQLKFKKWCKVL